MGSYRCAGTAACTVTLDADSMITAMSDGWIFTPDEGAMSPQPDDDYLSYGFWLKKTTDADDVVTYDEVETFAMSSMNASDGSTLDSVNGSASYTGGATGVYVHHVYSSGGGMLESSTSGHFTATAKLTANFMGGSIPADIHNTVTGTISSFMLSGGEMNDWSVALKGARAERAPFRARLTVVELRARSMVRSRAMPLRPTRMRACIRQALPASSTPTSTTALSPERSAPRRTSKDALLVRDP